MRICHVITKPELGGAQLSTLSLVSNLPKDKYTVSIVTSSRGILKADFEKLKNVRTYFLPFLIPQCYNSNRKLSRGGADAFKKRFYAY